MLLSNIFDVPAQCAKALCAYVVFDLARIGKRGILAYSEFNQKTCKELMPLKHAVCDLIARIGKLYCASNSFLFHTNIYYHVFCLQKYNIMVDTQCPK